MRISSKNKRGDGLKIAYIGLKIDLLKASIELKIESS
jgi:hypothetical protein